MHWIDFFLVIINIHVPLDISFCYALHHHQEKHFLSQRTYDQSGQGKTRDTVTFSVSPDKKKDRNKNETQSSWLLVSLFVFWITQFFLEILFEICFLLM